MQRELQGGFCRGAAGVSSWDLLAGWDARCGWQRGESWLLEMNKSSILLKYVFRDKLWFSMVVLLAAAKAGNGKASAAVPIYREKLSISQHSFPGQGSCSAAAMCHSYTAMFILY